ncbi:MAG: Hsp20/alpha crystallin family protein [Desulfobulbaceae bacterium]|nr:Hsp20/alpha crystallin family protein [Desulfobulbaceae bacterium]
MAIIRFTERPGAANPWAEFERIRQGLDHLSRNFLARDDVHGHGTVFPALNVYEENETLTIKAELPGVKADNLDISFEGDTLTIKGKRDPYHNGEKVSYHRREIETGNFSRGVTLPIKIDADTIAAGMRNGVLTITMEKAASVKPRKVNVLAE